MELEIAGKIKQHYVENGFGKTLYWVVKKSLNNIIATFIDFRKSVVIEKSLFDMQPFIKSTIDAKFKLGDLRDMDSFRGVLKPWDRFHRLYKERFQRGQTCIICFHRGKAIGYIWISFISETDKHYGLTVKPKNNESYGFDLYVLPEYRKFLVGFELISRWLKFSQDSGKEKAIGMVASYNHPMLVTTKLVFGFKKTKEVRAIEFFRRRGFVISKKDLS